MRSRTNHIFPLVLALGLATAGCGGDDPADAGNGTVTFTTWGEEYIEDEIPADPDGGFVDGWTLTYDRFLVNIGNIRVASSSGAVAASMPGSTLFDNTVEGVKELVSFDVPSKAYDDVGYEIAPVTDDAEIGPGAFETDRTMMVENGYSVYLAGTATKEDVEKRFAWGFTIGTRYEECHSELDGRDTLGLVVTNGGTVEAQLTTHGDHPFYDRLQASSSAVATSLRFDALAEADADDDGEITLEELDEELIDVLRYNPSGLDASTYREFVTELVRTVGHFRSEGECTVRSL
jgi:hypothetical protein